MLDSVVGPHSLLLASIDRHHELLRPQVELLADLVHDAQHLAVAVAGVQDRHLDVSMEHLRFRLDEPAERIGEDPGEPELHVGADPGGDRPAWCPEHPREIRRGGIVRPWADLPECLFEPEHEVDRQIQLLRNLPVRTCGQRRPAIVRGLVQEREGEAALLDGTCDRFDRQSPSVGGPHEPHAVHVRW